MEIPQINVANLTRGQFPVTIVEVESPGRFWVQPRPHREHFHEFLEELNWIMKRRRYKFSYWAHSLRPGVAVAIKSGHRWQRGVVAAIRGSKVRVQLKDWGREIVIPATKVHQLPKRFREDNWEAFECSLADAIPVGGHATWSSESCIEMEYLTRGKEAWIKIQEVSGNVAQVRVEVRGDLGGDDLYKILKEKGCAA